MKTYGSTCSHSCSRVTTSVCELQSVINSSHVLVTKSKVQYGLKIWIPFHPWINIIWLKCFDWRILEKYKRISFDSWKMWLNTQNNCEEFQSYFKSFKTFTCCSSDLEMMSNGAWLIVLWWHACLKWLCFFLFSWI